jgi:hypothetical protein
VLCDPISRRCLRTQPPYPALALFVLILAPLTYALTGNNFAALRWIATESALRGLPALHLIFKISNILATMLALALAGLALNRWLPARAHPASAAVERPALSRRGLAYLLCMGIGPLLLTIGLTVFGQLRLEWASPMFSLAALVLVAFLPLPRAALDSRRLIAVALAVSLGIAFTHVLLILEEWNTPTNPAREIWPDAEIGPRFDTVWREHMGSDLRIVGGDDWVAGTVGWLSAGHPSLYSRLDLKLSPGLTRERVRRDGVLVVWVPGSEWQPSAQMLKQYVHGKELFRWSSRPETQPVEIDYLLIPPVGISVDSDAPGAGDHDTCLTASSFRTGRIPGRNGNPVPAGATPHNAV